MFASDTLRPPAAPPPPSSSTTATTTERQRSSSFSDNPAVRSAQRVLGFGTTTTADNGRTSSFRRRSSGGPQQTTTQSMTNTTTTTTTNNVLGRNPSNILRSPPLNSTASSSFVGGGATTTSVPTLKTLDSYNARNVAAALDQGLQDGTGRSGQSDDVWQTICVRVLPLFNGEGIRGFVEDLNELVLTHVQRTFGRASTTNRPRYHPTSLNNPSLDLSSLVTGLLIADLTDLIQIGCSTLSTKISTDTTTTSLHGPTLSSSPAPSTTSTTTSTMEEDHKLLTRLNEIWLFFFTGILPHLEGVFWVLRCDDRLRAAVGGTGLERSYERRQGMGQGRIDVTRIALIEFRDRIVLKEVERIERGLKELYRRKSRTGRTTTRKMEENSNGYDEGIPKVQVSTPVRNPYDQSHVPIETTNERDIRRSRSQPRPSTESTSSQNYTLSPPPPPLPPPSTSKRNPHHPRIAPLGPIRQLSSPARLSPDTSPSNSPTNSKRPSMEVGGYRDDNNGFAKGGGGGGSPTRTRSKTQPPNLENWSSSTTTPNRQQPQPMSSTTTTTTTTQTRQSLARRFQMMAILKQLKTNDERQVEMERLGELLKKGNSLSSSDSARRKRYGKQGRRGEEDREFEASQEGENEEKKRFEREMMRASEGSPRNGTEPSRWNYPPREEQEMVSQPTYSNEDLERIRSRRRSTSQREVVDNVIPRRLDSTLSSPAGSIYSTSPREHTSNDVSNSPPSILPLPPTNRNVLFHSDDDGEGEGDDGSGEGGRRRPREERRASSSRFLSTSPVAEEEDGSFEFRGRGGVNPDDNVARQGGMRIGRHVSLTRVREEAGVSPTVPSDLPPPVPTIGRGLYRQGKQIEDSDDDEDEEGEGEKSSDGITPTASIYQGSTQGGGGGGGEGSSSTSTTIPSEVPSSSSSTAGERPNLATRRKSSGGGGGFGAKIRRGSSLFLGAAAPKMGRTNSGGSTFSQDTVLSNVTGQAAGGGGEEEALVGGGGGPEKLKRNLLLRRNSSRRSSTINVGTGLTGGSGGGGGGVSGGGGELVTVLGGRGLSMDDD